mgnify:CR=1 FL=1
MQLLMLLFNVLSKIIRAKAISHRSGPKWEGGLRQKKNENTGKFRL